MRRWTILVLVLLFGLMASSCANRSLAAQPGATPEPGSIQDMATFMAALQEAGATVEVGEAVSQPFFTPQGSILKVNGADVQVFEYESMQVMEEEASQVAP